MIAACPSSDQNAQSGSIGSERFRTTHWSVVLAAGRRSSPDARDALATLCQVYWYPLYAYVRRKGHSPDDAQDLTQAFFARLLEKNVAGKADRYERQVPIVSARVAQSLPGQGMASRRRRKRGDGRVALSLDLAAGESRYTLEPAHELTAEKIFERRWALTLLEADPRKVA